MGKLLTIGVDIRDLKVAKTGTRTYLLELCREFEKLQSNTVKFVFIDTVLPIYSGDNKLLKLIGHAQYQFWKQLSLPLKAWLNNCDILFCTDNFVPLLHLGYKTIPVFHDAFFFETPQNYGKLWLWMFKKTALPAAKRSPIIVTPTIYSKKQLQLFTNIPAYKLEVVVEGARIMQEDNRTRDLQRLNLPISRKQYILHVGSFFKRKNIPALIRAFAKLKQDGIGELKLVLAGQPPTNKAENDYNEIVTAIEEHDLKSDVVLTGYLSDESLHILYDNALLYAFPSINEGFGLPILEAFSHNIPVVVANNTCLPEVGGNAVLSFNPFDVNDIKTVLKEVLESEQLRQSMTVKGKEQLKKFTWQKAAEHMVELFKKAANYH